MYYTYMIRCVDNSIYTGITNDLKRRMNEHFLKTEKCAKYTLKHKPVRVDAVWESENRSLASKLEYNIKSLKKEQKEKIIGDNSYLCIFLKDKINIEMYKRLENEKINNILNNKI